MAHAALVVALCATAAVVPQIVDAASPSALVSVPSGGATATLQAERTKPPTPPAVAHFTTLPPGSALPSDATCAAQVRPAAERRAINTTANHTRGIDQTPGSPGVTGNFTGTTDEILQWAACKWGIDEDIVRAQIAKESWWHQDAKGDMTSNQANCAPPVRTTTATCPESVGLGQVRYQYHLDAFGPNNNAVFSSAYNVDYTYSQWRTCYEGGDTWLNTIAGGQHYTAGDVWGCVGLWFAGRWHTPDAETYIAAVKDYLNTRVWESNDFQGG